MKVWLGDVTHGAAIAHAAGVGFDPEVDRVISRVTVDGKLAGGFVFTNFSKVAIQVHCAGFMKGWLSRELLGVSFDYPFRQLHVAQMLTTVPSTQQGNLSMFVRAGWLPVAVVPHAVEDGDLIVLAMWREQCKWLSLSDRYIRRDAGQQELAA